MQLQQWTRLRDGESSSDGTKLQSHHVNGQSACTMRVPNMRPQARGGGAPRDILPHALDFASNKPGS